MGRHLSPAPSGQSAIFATTRADFERLFGSGESMERIRAVLEEAGFRGEASLAAREWLERVEREQDAAAARQQLELLDRTTRATEQAASASVASARAAFLAVLISIAALALAAWPYVAEAFK